MRILTKLVACTALAGGALVSPAVAQDPAKIATVVKISGIQWFNRMEEGVKKFAEDTGNDAFQVGPAQADPQQQAALIEDMIAQGVKALAVVPMSPEALEPVLGKAMGRASSSSPTRRRLSRTPSGTSRPSRTRPSAPTSWSISPSAWAGRASMPSSSAR